MNIDLLDKDDAQEERLLQDAFKQTIAAMDGSKGQIFEIYDNTKADVESTRVLLKDLKDQTRRLQDEVDELVRQEQKEKQKLVQVSSNFSNYSEERIRASYEAVKTVQVQLATVKEKEYQTRRQRDRLEIRLYNLEKTMRMAESLAMKLGSVIGYLTSQLSDVVTQMEIASKNKFLGIQIIRAQENERLRVSREIHDGPAQELVNLIYQASICERFVDTHPDAAKENLQELRRQLRTCLEHIRQIIFDMRPMTLDDLGLIPAIKQLVRKLEDRKILKVELQIDGKEYKFDNHVEVTIFRIIQEALTNVQHHAEVDAANVRLLYTNDSLAILVADTGKGFDVDRLAEERHNPSGEGRFGVIGMEERAKLIGANLSVISEPNKGTKIHIKMPYPQPR
ncbi:MAG: sensor histidine kinase [Anaerovibrio sp.]|uniref:sensor histidine kinase n=1 Tax=Anaerovibrio sp. TaxID=1872532 RepID=UPI0025F81EB9|nr:sensor histidine kinase [Anaerovibrio sp.]MCR5176483.1 sensor histidine kinase [Anaerovibrio sp.]